MFQFPSFPSYTYLFSTGSTALHRVSSLIRISPDITLICSSPRLFAACHVLLRLLMPRHSPYALISLNFLCIFVLAVSLRSLLEIAILSWFLVVFFEKTCLPPYVLIVWER